MIATRLLLASALIAGCAAVSFGQSAWSGTTDYPTKGTKVTHGTFEGTQIVWENQWYVGGADADTPGCTAAFGGTSAWKVINSLTPNTPTFTAQTCRTATPGATATVCVPTWRDGAKGAYTSSHDDICSMDYPGALDSGVKILNKHGIKSSFGAKVDACDRPGTDGVSNVFWLRRLVANGHEIISHSWNHTSAGGLYQWFNHGDTIPLNSLDPSIPVEIEGFIVDSTMKASPYLDVRNKSAYTAPPVNTSAKKIGVNIASWSDAAAKQISILALKCRDPWGPTTTSTPWGTSYDDTALNVVASKKWLDDSVYIPFGGNKWFAESKRTEYYIYAYDEFNDKLHAYIKTKDYVSARGGSKSGRPTSGNFYNPYRVDFDAYYNEDLDNEHLRIKLIPMVDSIIASNGAMFREFHAVTAGPDDYWGAVTFAKFDALNAYLAQKQTAREIATYTPAEMAKYRMTANATTGATISGSGPWTLTPATSTLGDLYKDEISFIVTLPSGTDPAEGMLDVKYGDGSSPRATPKKLGASQFSVYANPFKGPVTLTAGTAFVGQPEVGGFTDEELGIGSSISSKANVSTLAKGLQFNNGLVIGALPAGAFEMSLTAVNGKQVSMPVSGYSNGASVTASFDVKGLAEGFYLLNVKTATGLVSKKVMIAH